MADFSQELIKDFLEEAFDLLDSLEGGLLTLEKDSRDDKAINAIFRAAHTIKGGAGTVGFNEIQSLTHLMEDVLDMARKKTLLLQSEDITLFLDCRDVLARMLESREKGVSYECKECESIKNRLTALKGPAVSQSAPPKETPKAQPVTQIVPSADNVLNIALSNDELSVINEEVTDSGKNVFVLFYHLNEFYEMKEVSSFQIYALLNDISEIIKIIPSIEEMEKGFYQDVTFIVSTEKDEEFVRGKTNLQDMISLLKIVRVTSDNFKELENFSAHGVEISVDTALPEPKKAEVPQRQPVAEVKTEQEKIQAVQSPQGGDQNEVQKRNVSTLRVESWKVDELLNLLGELVITRASFSQVSGEFEKVAGDITMSLKEFLSGILKLNLVGDKDVNQEKNAVLLEALNMLYDSFDTYSESIQKLNRISAALQENVMNMRMVPVQMVFSRFPRLIRDMADKLGKKIELLIEGVETEIDKGMVDDLFDPLIHILRNAVDHGIENPEVRRKAGKVETGTIVLKALHEGDSIVIEVSDDGKGIDADAIKHKAIENGYITKEAADVMGQKDILELVYIPGLSTAKAVSDLSGRGVGMDVVKKKIEEIGGNVTLSTLPGKGSRIVIRLPLTLAIIQGLLILVKGMHYVIPVASVEETVIVNLKELQEINGRLTLELREKFVPILGLKNYFYGADDSDGKSAKEFCIVCKYGDGLVGIVVDEVIGEQDIVIKPLNTKLIKSVGISAATIIGNGEIGYIIDTSQVIAQYFKTHAA